MKSNTKSSITLPQEELRIVKELKSQLRLTSNVAVLRAALKLLKERTERNALRASYAYAATQVKSSIREELDELDSTSIDGLDEQ